MELLTTSEVAERLRIAEISVRKLVREGRLTPVRVLRGRAVRFTPKDVDELIETLRREAASR